MIGLHIQRPVPDWPRSLNQFPPLTWIKAVDNVQALSEAKAHNAGLKTVLRHWYDGNQIFDTTDHTVLRQRAREFFETFIDGTFVEQHAANVDAVEEWNEYNATSHTGAELAQRVAWADAVSWVWKNEYRTVPKLAHIRLVLGNVAIGNDLPWQYAKFAAERDCILGYHPYVPVRDKQAMAGEWEFYSGRWAVMDAAFRQRGYTCQWLFTEFGPVGYNLPASLNALDGWRHPRVCDADVNNYLQVIKYWLERTFAWNRANGHRALGAVLFTTGGGAQWQWFETRQPEIDAIAQFMGAWRPSPPGPPPPPPPPPEPTIRKYARTVHLLPQNATAAQAQAVMSEAYNRRQSVTWSADDSAINPDKSQAELTARNIHVWGQPPGGSQSSWEAWQLKHYPPAANILYRNWAELPGLFYFSAWPTLFRNGGLLGYGLNQMFGANPGRYDEFGLPGHEGIDFHTTLGSPIRAVAAGIVSRVFTDSPGYGVNVRIAHQNGYTTIYAHLSAADVAPGDVVSAGNIIGYGGNTGNSSGVHLHLTLRLDGARSQGLTDYPNDEINPLPYMAHLL